MLMRSLRECGVFALDIDDWNLARQIARRMRGRFYGIKVHPKFFGKMSPRRIYAELLDMGFYVWDDDKLSDIPSIVARYAQAAARGGADLVSVHGGDTMDTLVAAVEAYRAVPIEDCARPIPGFGIIAITPLTSQTDANVRLVHGKSLAERALNVAKCAELSGAYGVVCSPHEVRALRSTHSAVKYFTPGVRSPGVPTNDHDPGRVDTPANALAAGADYLVISREVLENPDGTRRHRIMDMIAAVDRIDESIAHLP